MAKLKKLLKQPPVSKNWISSQFFFQTYVTPIVHHATILEELKQKRQEILARQRKNAATNKEKANKKAQNMKSKATERTQHQEETCINEKRHSNEHYQTMIFGTLERMKWIGMMEHNTTIKSI